VGAVCEGVHRQWRWWCQNFPVTLRWWHRISRYR
jgi:hypothetical protein